MPEPGIDREWQEFRFPKMSESGNFGRNRLKNVPGGIKKRQTLTLVLQNFDNDYGIEKEITVCNTSLRPDGV